MRRLIAGLKVLILGIEEIPSDIDRSSWLMRCSNWKKRFAVNDCVIQKNRFN